MLVCCIGGDATVLILPCRRQADSRGASLPTKHPANNAEKARPFGKNTVGQRARVTVIDRNDMTFSLS
jgi:hypothetical protein